MGEVIAFQTRAKPSRNNSAPPAGDAQILFFLGVRYMRIEEPQDTHNTLSPDHGPRGGRKRKSRARA